MLLTLDGQPRDLIPIKDFRTAHDLPPDFGVTWFEQKDYTGLGRIDRAGAELNLVRAALLDALPSTLPATGWLAFLPGYARLFEDRLYAINDQVGLKAVEIEFAVAGLSDVLHHIAYALIGGHSPPRRRIRIPASEEGESDNTAGLDSPHRLRGGVRGGVSGVDRIVKTPVPWQSPREIYDALKLLARQMRKEPTLAESHLWKFIRNKQILGYKFRRQHSIDRFIVDFYCPDANLIIEVDGPIHDYTPNEDALRQAYLESLNLTVLRFTNDEVLQHTNKILDQIIDFLQDHTPSPHPLPASEEGESDNTAGIDSPHRLRGGHRGGVNNMDDTRAFFRRVYAEWLDNSVKVFSQVYPYEHQGKSWGVQIFAHAYGRAGLVVRAGDETHYLYDPALGCPAEGFMAMLVADISAQMWAATQP